MFVRESVLHMAMMYGSRELVRALFRAGADDLQAGCSYALGSGIDPAVRAEALLDSGVFCDEHRVEWEYIADKLRHGHADQLDEEDADRASGRGDDRSEDYTGSDDSDESDDDLYMLPNQTCLSIHEPIPVDSTWQQRKQRRLSSVMQTMKHGKVIGATKLGPL